MRDFAVSPLWWRSLAAAVVGHALELADLDVFEAACVDRRRRISRRVGAQAEGLTAAGGAKAVLDHMLVEEVGRQLAVGGLQGHCLPRNERPQRALAAAV